MPEPTLGIRHNNYLNVKNNRSDPWQGSTGSDKHGHAEFLTPEHGLRAAIITLRSYWFRHGLHTVADILARWAPASNTIVSRPGMPPTPISPEEYIDFVCDRMGVGPMDDLQLFNADKTLGNAENLRNMIKAMAEYENYSGFVVPDTEIDGALRMVFGDASAPTPPFVERELSETVPAWSDDPLLQPDQNLLGRAAFARYLAKRIDAISPESGAYSIHVYGPWGAGKTSLLNLLREELIQETSKGNQWLVVEFNAWRHQHIQPPWWSLMEAVFNETKGRLSLWKRLQEYWWRFNSGRLQYLVGLIILA